MDGPGDAPARRGRLHGRLLHVLGGFSALVAVVALWQLGVFGSDPDRDPVGAVEGPETDWLSAGDDGTSATASAEPASPTVESPSASSAEPTTQGPSDEATTSAAADETSAREEETKDEEEPPQGASCSATLTLNEEWDGWVEVTVEVVNTGGTEFESWAIDLDLDDADVHNHWGMRELDWDWYGSENWNGRLDPDENTVAGFQAETGRDFELPDTVSCTADD